VDLRRTGEKLVDWSREAARELLAGTGSRPAHVEAVARRAEQVALVVPDADSTTLIAAAYLHDVGYAPALRATGLHPLDGARWLRDQGVDRRVCNLVAHHSGARFEAEERGLLDVLDEFDLESGPVMDGLVHADMTTGPDGIYVSFEERLVDILARYPADDPIHRAAVRARPELRASVERTLQRLNACAHPTYGSGRASR
jgi:putative nucleotidyltransferase with HDIG domain